MLRFEGGVSGGESVLDCMVGVLVCVCVCVVDVFLVFVACEFVLESMVVRTDVPVVGVR